MKYFYKQLIYSTTIFFVILFGYSVFADSVSFSGWEYAKYKEIVRADGTKDYYPSLKSKGLLQRINHTELYLIIADESGNNFHVLQTYKSSSFHVKWPDCNFSNVLCVRPILKPNINYYVYISDSNTLLKSDKTNVYGMKKLGNIPIEEVIVTSEKTIEKSKGVLQEINTKKIETKRGIVYNNTQQNILDKGIVPHDCGYNLGKDKKGKICGFKDAIALVDRIIQYIFILVIPITAIMFAYAGFIYLTSGGNTEKLKIAKKIMLNVLIGIVVIMAAWLIVKTVVTSLGVKEDAKIFLGK